MDYVRLGSFFLDVLHFDQQNAICHHQRAVVVMCPRNWLMSCEPDLCKSPQSLLMSGGWLPGPAVMESRF